jgi:hypothetical protein
MVADLLQSLKKGCFFKVNWLSLSKDSVMKGKKPNHRRGTALAESREFQGTQIKGRLWIEGKFREWLKDQKA